MLTMPIRTDMVRTILVEAARTSVPMAAAAVAELVGDANAWLDLQGATGEGRQTEIRLDMRYRGQNYELPVSGRDPGTEAGMQWAVEEFHRAHQQAYGYAAPARAVEIVNVRISATTRVPGHDAITAPTAASGPDSAPAPIEVRSVLWSEQGGFVDTPIFARTHVRPGQGVAGPAILEQIDSTVVLPPGASALADAFGCLVIEAGTADEHVC